MQFFSLVIFGSGIECSGIEERNIESNNNNNNNNNNNKDTIL
jgi:hypothetical protein